MSVSVPTELSRLLLISNSTQYGSGYLEHCATHIKQFLGTGVKNVLFVPYALKDHDGYAAKASAAFEPWGYTVNSLHNQVDKKEAVKNTDAVFIGGGNTFRLLNGLYHDDIVDLLHQRIGEGMPYIGTSAGSNVACLTIKTTNDMPIVYPPSFDAIAAVPFQINAHYLDPEVGSQHMGETREKRLKEFHEENPYHVFGIREGSMLLIEGAHKMTALGTTDLVLFRQGKDPLKLPTGSDLSEYLAEAREAALQAC